MYVALKVIFSNPELFGWLQRFRAAVVRVQGALPWGDNEIDDLLRELDEIGDSIKLEHDKALSDDMNRKTD